MPETPLDRTAAMQTARTEVDGDRNTSHIELLQRAAIGPVHIDYYLPIVARFESYGRGGPGWNWAAGLCTLNWMLFRGLWMAALAYVGTLLLAVAALVALTRFGAPLAESIQWGLWAALALLAFVLPGLFGNIWLFANYRQRLVRALSSTPTLRDACQVLSRQAASRQRLVVLAVANGLLALLVAALWYAASAHERPTALAHPVTPPATGALQATQAVAPTPVPMNASVQDPAGSPAPVPAPAAAPPSASASTPEPVIAAPPTVTMQTPAESAAPGIAAADAAARHGEITARSRQAHRAAPLPPTVPEAVAPPQSRPTNAATPPPPRKAADDGLQINVGLFAQDDNAQRAHARLQQAGLPAQMQVLQTRNGKRTRVRVGPFATRAQAEAAALKIRAMQLDAVVVRP